MKKPIILVALLVVVGLGGYLVYDNVFSSEADEEFTLDSATTGSTAGSGGDDNAGGDDAAADRRGEGIDGVALCLKTETAGALTSRRDALVGDEPLGRMRHCGHVHTCVTLVAQSCTLRSDG